MSDTAKESRFDLVIGAVDKLTEPFRRINAVIAKNTQGIRRLKEAATALKSESGLGKLGDRVQGFGSSLKGIGSESKALVSTLSGLAARASLLTGAAGGGLFALVKGTADAADQADLAAKRAGVGLKTWQEYSYIAEKAEVSTEQLSKSFVKVQEAAIKAAGGDKTAMLALKAFGIQAKNTRGEIKNADTLFQELATRVQTLQEAGQGAKAVNLVKNLLGEEGVKLMPMLTDGAAGIAKFRKEANDLGLVFSGEFAESAAAFNDTLDDLKNSGKGLGYTLGIELLPVAKEVAEAISGWIKENRALIKLKVTEWVHKLKDALPQIKEGIVKAIDAVSSFAEWVSQLAEKMEGWGNLLLLLAAFMGAKLVFAVAMAAKAFFMLGAAIMTTPVGWIMAGIAAIAGAVYLIYKNWDSFAAYFSGLWQEVKDAFAENWVDGILTFLWNFNPVRLVAKGISELIAYFTGVDLAACGQGLIDSFGEGLSKSWRELMQWFTGKLKTFTEAWAKVKSFFGFGDGEASVTLGDDGGDYPRSPKPSAFPPAVPLPAGDGPGRPSGVMGAPVGAAALAGGVSQMQSTHVERKEAQVELIAPEGWRLQRSGGTAEGVQTTHNGMLIGVSAAPGV